MEYKVELQPSGRQFPAQDSESILEAGLRAGVNLNYHCDNGSCGECKAYLVRGRTRFIHHADYAISESEKVKGAFLICSSAPVSDLVIEAQEAHGVEDIASQEISARVKGLVRLQDDLMIMRLKTPRSQTLRFLAGQNVLVSTENGISKELPLASCPCDGMNLEFHLRRTLNDVFDDYVFEQLKKNSPLRIEGPCGKFVLDEESQRTLIMIAYDTGFAAIRSLIDHAMALELPQEIFLYRLASKPEDRYLDNICRSWEDAMENVHYTYMDDCLERNDEKYEVEQYCDLLVSSLEEKCGALMAECDFYLSGNQLTLGLLLNVLSDKGIPSSQIKTNPI